MLSVKNLEKSYTTGNRTYTVLKGISFSVAKGEFVAVMGPSGSGKSTLLNCISCYIPFEKGRITLGGQELSSLTPEQLASVRNESLALFFRTLCFLTDFLSVKTFLFPESSDKMWTKKGSVTQISLWSFLVSVISETNIRQRFPAETVREPQLQEV